ncbi:MAG TPA: alpha/beta fold hydrolase [Burkholderiaceae bacterium]|nr:alpha/beta fold hydrolase [Burkholderiaceae bacterium]
MSQPPLLLLPGLTCDQAVWADQIAALSASVACLVPAYGSLDSLPAMAQAVLREAPPRFALAGHSMGGRVALEIMRAQPQRVTRLALLDTGWQARPIGEIGDEEARRRQRLLDIAHSNGMRAMGREWLIGMVHPERLQDQALIEAILAMIERCSALAFAGQIRALLNRPEASDVLSAIDCPTLLLCGREDAWSPLARHEAMARLVARSRLEVIERSGHMSTMERPADVSAALKRWLAE